jgi:uncharacterized protein (TIGR00730 family)
VRHLGRVGVFCGSSTGTDGRHLDAAWTLGQRLAADGIGLVYGGGAVGLMGVVADGCIAGGGEVVGVIPRRLFAREVVHRGVAQLVEVASMHERKQRMYELADGFAALPGGLGTLEELAEVLTWNQLGIHAKPLALVDVAGHWDGLLAWLDRSVDDGFLRPEQRRAVVTVDDVADVVAALRAAELPPVPRLLDLDET